MPTITLDNATTLHYSQRGTGRKNIVLVHGFPLDSRMWEPLLPTLGDGVRVIMPDLPGFGRSASERSFTIKSLAEDLHRLLIKLDCCPIVLGGFSMGGYVALAYAKEYPMDLAGLMLIDTRAEGDSAEGREKRNRMIEMVQQRGRDASKAVADQMMPNMIAPANANDQMLTSAAREIMQACPQKTIEHALAAMRDRPDQTDLLPSIACPTLIVVGENDAITPPSAATAMEKAIPQAAITAVSQAGHLAPMEKPAEVGQAIIDFVNRL